MEILLSGERIGSKYRVEEFLGQGATSQVYKVFDLVTEQIFALKLFSRDFININYICQEFCLLAELDHPNLAKVYHYEHTDKGCFYILEYLPGPDILEFGKSLSTDGKCRLLIDLCHALEFIHSRDIIHLDLKPSNLLLDGSGNVKLLDFGLAQNTSNFSPLAISGTPSYMSPEVISGQPPDGRADLYSLGILMYQMFAHRLPFESSSLKELIKSQLYQPPQPLKIYDPAIPEQLQNLILKLLQKDPNARQMSAGEVSADLAKIIRLENASPPSSIRPPFIFSTRMIGRDREMNELRQAAQNAIAGQGASIFISGETGIGRTKLLTEFSLQAQLMECQVLWARCYQPDTAAYFLIGQLLDQVRSLARHHCPQLLQEFGPQLAEISPAFLSLQEASKITAPVNLPEQERRLRLLDAIASFLIKAISATSFRSTVILLEGLHWADRESIEAIYHLIRNIPKTSIMFVGSYRSDDVAEGHHLLSMIERLVAENLSEQLFLKRLSRSEVSLLLRNIFSKVSNMDPLLEKIYQETEGNPLAIEEAVYYLIDSGTVERRHGQWRINLISPDMFSFPHRMNCIGTTQLVNLSLTQKAIMQSLSVLERPATFHEISKLTELEAGQIGKDLLHLKGHNLLAVLQEANDEPRYGLHHYKIVREIYGSIPKELSRQMHRNAALLMEQYGTATIQDTIIQARHWELAGEKEISRKYHILAGDGLAEFSKSQAIDHYRKALDLFSPDQDINLLEKLQKLYYVSGEFSEAFKLALELYRLDKHLPDIHYKLGRCQERLGNYEASLEYLKQGILASAEAPEAMARLMGAMAITNISRGDYGTAEKTCHEALKMLPPDGKPTIEAEIFNTLGLAYWHLAEWSQALSVHRKSLEIKDREGSLYGIATSYNNLGMVYYRMYEWDKAAECHKKSFALREKIGDISGLARSNNNLALIYRHLYDWDKALEYHTKCLQTMERIGSNIETATSLINIGYIHAARSEWDRALWSFNRAIQIATSVDAKNILLDAYIRKAELYLALGSLDDSNLFCQKSIEMAQKLGGRLELGRALNISGRISQMRQQWDKAKDSLSQAREIFSGLDIKAGEAYILKNLADLHRELGELDEAGVLSDKAMGLANRVEEHQLVAEILLLKGELLEERNQNGYRYMEWSLEVANRVNMMETIWPIYSAMARHHLKSKNHGPALECYQQILSSFKRSMENISQPELKTSYILAPKRRHIFKDIKHLRQEVLGYAG
jgi:tetratricopeptide (TPR) repeat protein